VGGRKGKIRGKTVKGKGKRKEQKKSEFIIKGGKRGGKLRGVVGVKCTVIETILLNLYHMSMHSLARGESIVYISTV
jgi:hypothetical protein